MRVVSRGKLCGFSFFLLCFSGLLVLADSHVRDHSENLIAAQTKYLRGVNVVNRMTEAGGSNSDGLKKLHEEGFFTRSVTEPAIVTKVKSLLGPEYKSLHFENMWDLLWHADFFGNDAAFYRAAKSAIEFGSFRISDDCLNFKECEVEDKKILLNEANGRRLFRLLRKKYVERAIEAYENLAIVEAKRLITDGVNLSRQFRIDPEASLPTTRAYNAVVVPLVFMSKYVMSNSVPRADDIRALLRLVDDVSVSEDEIEDNEIRQYAKGVSLMHNGCFIQSSRTFESSMNFVSKGTPLELASFMSMRALARPFLDVYKEEVLVINQEQADVILVSDCGEKIDSEIYKASFLEMERRAKRNVTHDGLLADLAFYKSKMPFSADVTKALRSSLLASAKERPEVVASPEARSIEQLLAKETKRASMPQPSGSGAVRLPKIQTESESADEIKPLAFSWPARGSVIARYGDKIRGKANKGINLKVPEGTAVRASEDGLVAYSGDENDDYGTLVLIKHSGSYSTAYAHVSDSFVKPGDVVRRSQTIARSGKSGGVESPQLHFEIRKGSLPLDPMPLLGASASNLQK